MIFLETRRLILRNVEHKDVSVIFDYRNNPCCARYQRGQTKTFDGICDLVKKRRQDILGVHAPSLLAVALKDTDQLVGEIVVMPNEDTFSLGYTFHYSHHRKGYAFEALSGLTALLHEQQPEWEFICFTDPDNIPSMALLKKLGFRDMGYLPRRDSQVFGKWTKPETDAELAQLTQH